MILGIVEEKEKEDNHNKVGDNKCTIGRPEGPDWKLITLNNMDDSSWGH